MRITYLCRKTISVILFLILSSKERLFPAEEIDALVLDINIDYSHDPFYSKLWFWVIIAVVLFFLLVLLIRGSKKKTKLKKEVIEE